MKFAATLLIVSLCFLVQTSQKLISQSIYKPFVLSGYVSGLDSGTVQILKIIADDNFRQIKYDTDRVEIRNSHFIFRGSLTYPHPVNLIFTSRNYFSVTETLFLSGGNHFMNTNIDSIKDQVPYISNSLTNDFYRSRMMAPLSEVYSYLNKFETMSQKLYSEYNGKIPKEKSDVAKKYLDTFKVKRKNYTLDFIKKNTTSVISLWKIVERISINGYDIDFEIAFNSLSNNLKRTKTGIYLARTLKETRVTGVGATFPKLALTDLKDKKDTIVSFYKHYTLIDFWFSHCGPCIAEFPKLAMVYDNFKEQGFEIIGISVDTKQNKVDWQKAIAKYNLTWKQFWDVNGFNAYRLFVNAFPTNFLLDEKGTIIQKNITPDALNKFLERNLHK